MLSWCKNSVQPKQRVHVPLSRRVFLDTNHGSSFIYCTHTCLLERGTCFSGAKSTLLR